jgi:hypothetical protein
MFEKVYFGLPLFESITSGGFLPTLIICLIICPGIPFLLGAIVDGYWVPIHWKFQFFAFWPGNLFLAWFIAGSASTFQHEGMRVNPVLNVLLFIGAFVFYWQLQKGDRSPSSRYSVGQVNSAMKLYHNALYFWYGYLAVVSCAAMLMSSAAPVEKFNIMLPGLVWVAGMVADNFMPEEIKALRFAFAHVEPKPIWCNGWRIRRLTRLPRGYAYV